LVGFKLNILTYIKEHGNSTAETHLGVLQLSKYYMNGGSNRHNYETYKRENMLPVHMLQNGHKLQKQLKTACLQVFMITGVNTMNMNEYEYNHFGLTCLSC
jgi:hypothetical protein